MINIRIQNNDVSKLTPKITVVGVGGAGGNAVNNMISSGLQGADFLVCNTDAQALEGSLCDTKIQLGVEVTGGLGAGARPEVGSSAAQESIEDVMQYLDGANMVFITAGMGGGTGTGAAPVIAQACREKGILTVGVVTKPFHFEGTLRMKMAEQGIDEMQNYVDTLIVIPNQNLFRIANEKTTFAEAFKMADGVLQSGVRGVTDLMVMPGLINLDFADIRSAMQEMGKAMMGTGEASGDRRSVEAAEAAINNPLLDDVTMKGARGVIINVTGGYDMTLFEVDEACNRIRDEVDPHANIIFGSTFDEELDGVMRVSVVATGIDVAEAYEAQPSSYGVKNTQATQKTERTEENVGKKSSAERQQHKLTPTPPARSYEQGPKIPHLGRTPPGAMMPPLPLNVRPAPAPMQVSSPVAEKAEQEDVVHSPSAVSGVNKSEDQETAQGRSMRGERYKDSFIPPQPVETEQRRGSGYGPQLGSLAARRTSEPQSRPESGTSLSLQPPVPGTNTTVQKKRSQSLFERFTNQLLHPGGGEEEHETGDSRQSGRPGAEKLSRSESGTAIPQQGSLNIDVPKDNVSEDELDIPAFLRRQAN